MSLLITAKELADAQHYDESEHDTIQMFIDGAEAFLEGDRKSTRLNSSH